MIMLHLRSVFLLLLPLALARDVSLYAVPPEIAQTEPAQQPAEVAFQQDAAGSEQQLITHYPEVPQIRAAMQGLAPLPVVAATTTKAAESSPFVPQQEPTKNDASNPPPPLQQQQQQVGTKAVKQVPLKQPQAGVSKQVPPKQPKAGAVKQTGGPKTRVTTPKQQPVISAKGATSQQPGGLRATAPEQQSLSRQKSQQSALNGAAGGTDAVAATTANAVVLKNTPQRIAKSPAAIPKQNNPQGTAQSPRVAQAASATGSPPNKPQGVSPQAGAAKGVSPQQQAGPASVQAQGATGEDALPEFDFIVAGFPKCGTTTLLKSFEAHPEIAMAGSEQCAVAAPSQPDAIVLKKLDQTMGTLGSDASGAFLKRAFKCPTAVYQYKSIIRLEKHSPGARLIIGLRHPVLMMMSFVNYRVAEIYQRGLQHTEPIPDFLKLLEDPRSKPWKGVSMEAVRFEKFLQQLGKTHMTVDAFAALAETEAYELAVKPSSFQIFLYEISQLEDEDEMRSAILRRELQTFLGLSTPLAPFGKENVNHVASDTDAAPAETISICDPEFAHIRSTLLENAHATVEWLNEHFLDSPDVTIANPEHFRKILEDYTVDPCDATATLDGATATEPGTVAEPWI